ncbi:MAG: hypothetical protein R3185_08900, partial [Candidatus Thermoplasmatota archaeon]|nr:hypothetical protein [Candidatus Thermoplasmatota archaeon]
MTAWMDALPYALALSALVALWRPRHLRQARPGFAPSQRLGLILVSAPLFLLLLVGLASVPRLLEGAAPLAVPTEVLAGKAVLHFLLYLAVPLVGLLLVMGRRGLGQRLQRHLV